MQRVYGGVRVGWPAPSIRNVELLDRNSHPMISYMQANGLQVDLSHFARMETDLTLDMERITEEVHSLTGVYINLDSPAQVSDLLFKQMGMKQARVALTPSGDRESVDEEVLRAIQHEHPVVGKILNYREYSKLRGTYVTPMPKLARRVAFGKWKMFPNFTSTRIPSGRYACKEPNLLAMPTRTDRGQDIRRGFITDEGWEYVSVDFCFHPNTNVETLIGPKPIGALEVGDKVLTKRGDYIKYGEVTRSSVVPPREAYKLIFDNGESVISSYDHRWPIRERKRHSKWVSNEKTTEELSVGESMVPCRVGDAGGYKTWYSKGYMYYTKQHHLIAEAYLGPRPDGTDIHHKDENKDNNLPDNLEYKDGHVHKSDHAKSNYAKQDHTSRLERLREGLKARRSYNGSENPNSKLSAEDKEDIESLVHQGFTATQIAKFYNLSYGYTRRLYKSFQNHKLISKEYVGMQPMWAITVEPDHNYVLSAGVVTHNSQIEVRMAAHLSQDPTLMAVYFNEEDVYSDFAITAFKLQDGRYQDEKGKWQYPHVHKMDHRYPAKTCILASIYDVSAPGLLDQMPIICANCGGEASKHTCSSFKALWTEEKCQQLINSFYAKYQGVMKDRKRAHAIMRRNAYIYDMWGRIVHTAAVRSVHEWIAAAALREGANHPYQGGACGVLKVSMAHLWDDLEGGNMLDVVHPSLVIHDELLSEVREDVADEWAAHNKYRFETDVKLTVPIKAGSSKAESWGAIEK